MSSSSFRMPPPSPHQQPFGPPGFVHVTDAEQQAIDDPRRFSFRTSAEARLSSSPSTRVAPVVKAPKSVKPSRPHIAAFADTDNVVDKVIVSQLINRERSHIIRHWTPMERSQVVTRELLVKTLSLDTLPFTVASRKKAEARKQSWLSRLMSPAADDDAQEGGSIQDIDDAVAADIEFVLSTIRFGGLKNDNFTVEEALTFDCDGFVHLDPTTVDKLKGLTDQLAVSREQVEHVLNFDAMIGDDFQEKEETLDSIFPFDSPVISGVVLEDFLSKVDTPVNKVRFSTAFVRDVLHSMRSLAISIPYLILIIIFFAMVQNIDLWSRFASFLNASTPEEPWSNFCHGDVVNGSCYFHKRNIEEAVSAEETLQFVQTEIVNDLWKYTNGSQGASQVPFEGSWLLGALIFRTSPTVGFSNPDGSSPLYSCDSLNLSQPILEPRIGEYIDCTSWHSVVIPFSRNRSVAMSESAKYSLDIPQFTVGAVVVQYAMLQPSTGNIVWTSIILSIPKFGGVVARVQKRVMDDTMKPIIAVGFWFSVFIWFLDLFSLVLLRNLSIGRIEAVGSVLFRTFLLCLIAVSYNHSGAAKVTGVLSDEFTIRGLDSAVDDSVIADQLFAIWALFLIVLLVQFIGFLDGFRIIVKLVERILPEILGLFFVFGFAYVMFVLMAMILFGQTNEKYCTFFNANAQLIQYFLLHFDLETLMENEPQSGFAFYYVFRMFLFYLVLNFFIVTVIAPIRSVWLEGDLPIAVNGMLEKLHGTSTFQVLYAEMVRIGIMGLDLLLGFVPFTFLHWYRAYHLLVTLYDPQSQLDAVVAASKELLELRQAARNAREVAPYTTERARALANTKLSVFASSYTVSLLLILTESNHMWIRDARTMRLLSSFDEFQTELQRDLEPMEDEQESVMEPSPPEDLNTEGSRKKKGDEPQAPDMGELLTADEQLIDSTLAGSFREASSNGFAEGKATDRFIAKKRRLSSTGGGQQQRVPAVPSDNDASSRDPRAEIFPMRDGVDGSELQFHFTRFLMSTICVNRFPNNMFYVLFGILNRLAILAIYLAMLVTVASTPRNIAYFSRNAHSGIRDLPYRQSCDDPLCESGFTKLWTYTDNKRLDHLRMFIDRRLVLSLYGHSSSHTSSANATSHARAATTLSSPATSASSSFNATPVNWDPNVRLSSPIFLRQLRALQRACDVPFAVPDESSYSRARHALLTSAECGELNGQSTEHMPFPKDSLLDVTAYQYASDDCPEIGKSFMTGIHNWVVPCQGYIAAIFNESQLRYAMDHWIDSRTRFLGISFTLEHHGVNSEVLHEEERLGLQYNLYAEFSEGGSAGQFYTRTIPLSDPDLNYVTDVGMTLIGVDFIFAVLELLIPVLRCVWLQQYNVIVTLRLFSFRIAVFFAYLIGHSIRQDQVAWPRLCISCLLVLWLTYETMFEVVFPFSQFFFRRVTIVNHFIRITFVKVTLLIPVFAIILSSFAISGNFLWAGHLPAFASMHTSFLTVSQGLFGDFEFSEMYAINASYAMIYMILFLIIVIIFLLNLLLAVIAGCADEARDESQMMAPIEVIGRVMHRRVYYGPIVGVIMMFLLDRQRRLYAAISARGEQANKEDRPDSPMEISSSAAEIFYPTDDTGDEQNNAKKKKKKKKAKKTKKKNGGSEAQLTTEESLVEFFQNEESFAKTPQRMNDFSFDESIALALDNFDPGSVAFPSTVDAANVRDASGSRAVASDNYIVNTLSSSFSVQKRQKTLAVIPKVAAALRNNRWGKVSEFLFEKPLESGERATSRVHLLEHARLPTPLECLLPYMGPILLAEVAHALHLRHLPEALQCSIVAYILASLKQFQMEYPGLYAADMDLDEERQIQVLRDSKRSNHLEHVSTSLSSAIDAEQPSQTTASSKYRKRTFVRIAGVSVDITDNSSSLVELAAALRRAAKRGKSRIDVFVKHS